MRSFLFAIMLMSTFIVLGQPYKTLKVYKPYKWMIGVSCNGVDDDGQMLSGLFDIENSWNYIYFPSSVNFDKYLKKGWGFEGVASYTQYKRGTLINDSTNYEGHFISIDANFKYHFQYLYAPNAKWFDPFVSLGIGYTYRSAFEVNAQHIPTVDIGAGINLFFTRNVGFQFRTMAKFGVYPVFGDTPSNYLHHSAGLILRIQPPKHTNGDFAKRKHKWAFGNKRFRNKGGH